MKVDLMTMALPLRRAQDLARDAERAGIAGLVVTESGRTAYLTCAAAALASDLDLATGIAVAFPRSPMVSASVAWELAEATGGKFRLGLGTQVRAHIERRYGSAFEHPGPRLKDYVAAVRAAFAAFRGEPLAHDGPFYKMNLMPAQWSPGKIAVDDPPIDIAAVNPYMLRLAGEVADGVHIHPLNHPRYLTEVVRPNLEEGAAAAGRDASKLEIIVPCFTAVGDSDAERARWRELARAQVSFYGSTPGYGFVFEILGRDGTHEKIRERQKAGDFAGMAQVIDDDLLDHFLVTATWDDLADRLVERFSGHATRVVLYFASAAWGADPSSLERFGAVAKEVAGRGAH